MTFSFNLVLGLFLLAPGLSVFAGLYHGSRLGPIHSPPPPPGSILALSIVTVGALVAHLIGAALFWGQDVLCGHLRCLSVAYNPNVYTDLFDIAENKPRVGGSEVVTILLDLTILTAMAFALARWGVAALGGEAAVKGLLFGWLADLAVPQSDAEAVLAYVVSDVQDDGTVVGYEGVVANMTTNADKEITSILLESCETFYLRVTPAGIVRRKAARAAPIPQLYLDRTRIENIAFERVRFKAAS